MCGTQMATDLTTSKQCHGPWMVPGRAAGGPVNEDRGAYVFDHHLLCFSLLLGFYFIFSLRNNLRSKHIVFFLSSLLLFPPLSFGKLFH